MQKVSGRKLDEPMPFRPYRDQRTALDYLAITNYDPTLQHLIRTSIDIMTGVARMNGGTIPPMSMIKLQKALVRRARTDSRRK